MSTQSDKNNSVRLVIYGEPASKANSRIVRVIRGRVLNIKSQKAQGYKAQFLMQCPVVEPMLTGDLSVTIKIYYASRRPDLDPSLILDLMQGRIYLNDRQIKEQHLYWGLDPEAPRAEILVEQGIKETLPGKARPAKGRRKARTAG